MSRGASPKDVENAFVSGAAPGALPLLGHGLHLMRRPLQFLQSLPEHGDLVEVRLGPQRAYVVCNPELTRRVLVDDRTFDKGGAFFERMRDFLGNGLATCPHADHRRQRRLMQPAFHSERLPLYGQVFERETATLLGRWRDGQIIEPYSEFYRFSMRTVIGTLFTSDVEDRLVDDIQRSFETVINGTFTRMLLPPALERLPTPGNRRYRRAITTLTTAVDKVVADYRDAEATATAARDDLLSALFAARDDDRTGLTDQEIRDQVVTLLAAGTETSAAAHTWSCHLIAQHPDAQRRLHAEVDAVLGGRSARWADLPGLSYAGRVVREAMRLYPPAWLLTRTTSREVVVAGRRLAPGTTIVFSPHINHQQSELFERPAEFDPDRWLPERAEALPRAAYLAFGHGARRCIGDQFGLAESTLALASIASRWHLSQPAGTTSHPIRLTSIVYPRHLRIALTQRPTS